MYSLQPASIRICTSTYTGVKMNMTSGVVGFILLASVLNSTLYVTKPRHVYQCAITVDYDESLNDTYPDQWISMEKYGRRYCKINIKNNLDNMLIRFKVRYISNKNEHWSPTEDWTPILYDMKNVNHDKLNVDPTSNCSSPVIALLSFTILCLILTMEMYIFIQFLIFAKKRYALININNNNNKM